jgi:hypothetical protein
MTAAGLLLPVLILAMALLYSSVGHAGASGYLAAMALFGVAPATMKPSALVLNVLVAAIGTVQFARAGRVAWSSLWPFAAASIPFAFLGGALHVPDRIYKPLVGLVLLFAAGRLVLLTFRDTAAVAEARREIPRIAAAVAGAAIGLLAGLTGTGGGIFLSPLLLLTGWAGARETAGMSVAFILVNSAAGLAGNLTSVQQVPQDALIWAIAAMAGGFVGSRLGSRRLASATLRRLLGLVLVIAGTKLLLGI